MLDVSTTFGDVYPAFQNVPERPSVHESVLLLRGHLGCNGGPGRQTDFGDLRIARYAYRAEGWVDLRAAAGSRPPGRPWLVRFRGCRQRRHRKCSLLRLVVNSASPASNALSSTVACGPDTSLGVNRAWRLGLAKSQGAQACRWHRDRVRNPRTCNRSQHGRRGTGHVNRGCAGIDAATRGDIASDPGTVRRLGEPSTARPSTNAPTSNRMNPTAAAASAGYDATPLNPTAPTTPPNSRCPQLSCRQLSLAIPPPGPVPAGR